MREYCEKPAPKYGIRSLSLLGSVARNEAHSAGDVDLLVASDRPMGYFGLFALQDPIESLLQSGFGYEQLS
jgi:uncharacterized protein